jgi:hypothetical protein
MSYAKFRVTCTTIILLFSTALVKAQSTLTLSIDVPGLHLKYAYAGNGLQAGIFVMQGIIPPLRNHELLSRYGVFLNSVSNRNKKTALYFGGALEYLTYRHNVKYWHEKQYMDQCIAIGPHMGLNRKLNKLLTLNAEWGFRAGIYKGLERWASAGGANGYNEYRTFIAYPNISIGISYRLGKEWKE